jgi:hypothetical protein
MQQPTHFFTQAAAEFLAHQNTATDGEWTYKAEPAQDNPRQLYIVKIYDQDGQPIGAL